MALSAMSRTNEMIGLTMLIDILRGSARAELIERGYDRIKTYGVGRDLSFSEWNAYLSQMLQLGIIEIAYTESNHLKITPYGRSILKGERTVMLAKFFFDKTSSSKKRKSAAQSTVNPAEQLFSELKRLRLSIARNEGVAPYIVFSDKTLMEMVRHRPVNMREFIAIEGVGERKAVKYWAPFTSLIKNFRKSD